MANVLVHNATTSSAANKSDRTQCFTSPLVGYQFYADSGSNDLAYKKTTDGGQTWGSAVEVSNRLINGFSIWFDKWTPGQTGTVIHIGYIDDTGFDVYYKSLDTATDTLGTETLVYDGAGVDTRVHCSIAKMRGGNLYLWFTLTDTPDAGLYRSTDAGANWTERSDTGLVENDGDDIVSIFPGNESDNQDAWLLYLDRSANELSLKVHDDSGNSTTETAIGAMTWISLNTSGAGFSGSVRLSDNHLIVAFFNDYDIATGDLKVYDIGSTASITAKTNIATDKDDMFNPCVFINQTTDRIYVAYAGKADGSEDIGTSVTPSYQHSGDGGTTWSGEQAYSEAAANFIGMSCSLGGTNTRFIPSMRDVGLSDIFVNYANSVAVTSGGSPPGNSGNAPGRGRGNPTPGSGGGQGGGGGGGGGTGGGQGNPLNKGFLGTRRRTR